MAIALVGSLGTAVTGTGSVSPTFGQNTTAGNLLIAWVMCDSPTDNITTPTGWTKLFAGGAGDRMRLYYKGNCGATETAPSFSSSGASMAAQLGEFSGASTVSPGYGNTSGSSNPTTLTNSAADLDTGSLIIAQSNISGSAVAVTVSFSANNATMVDAGNNDSTATTEHYHFAYGITTSNASADSVTITNALTYGSMAVFMPATVGIKLVKLGSVSSGTSSVQPAFGQATTAGNLLVSWAVNNSGAAMSINQGWTIAKEDDGSALSSAVAYKANCGASETAPTWSATSANITACLAEFSGAATVSPSDQSGSADGTTSSQTATAAAVDAQPADLVLASQNSLLSKAGTTTTTHTYNNGASANGNLNNDATSTANHYRFDYGWTNNNPAADNLQGSDTSMNLLGLTVTLASFKAAAAPAAAGINKNSIFIRQAVNRSSTY